VALGKMLNLGGIDNRPPKANQSMGRFRVARNVYPTPDGTIIPRYDWEFVAGSPARVKAIHHIAQYDTSAIKIVSRDAYNTGAGTEVYQAYKDTTLIPGPLAGSPFQVVSQDINNSVMSFRRNNTTYFMLPEFANNPATLSKYDGVQMWNMGCAQPIISTTSVDGSTYYVRVIQHTIDFDNNQTDSEYVEFGTSTVSPIIVNGAGAFVTNMISSGRATYPDSVIAPTGKPTLFFRGTSAYNAGTLDYTITTTDTNIGILNVGEYVMVDWTRGGANLAAAGLQGFGLALKVKSVSPLKLDATGAKYLDLNREWKTSSSTLAALGAGLTIGTQSFFSFWRGPTRTGAFFYSTFTPSFPNSSVTFPISVDTTPTTSAELGSEDVIISIGSTLNDFYDVTSSKLSPNSIYPFGLNYGIYAMTVFQGLLLLASDDLIWISDPTLNPSFEQLEKGSFIRVGDTEFGRITSICATNDFLFVSRERKNYYVTGNITTGNYRVQEIIEAEIGAWNNSSSINVKDSVVFLTAIGVFQMVGGGKATRLSETCPKNFATYDNRNINEDVSFRMTGFVSDITNATIDGIAVGYDEYRELLVFMKKGVIDNPCLVLHTKTGEFYEWDGIISGVADTYANCINFIQGTYRIGEIDYTASGYAAVDIIENYTLIPTYQLTNPVKLYSSWLTAGEPSLEKELLQLKIFGRIQSNSTTSSITVTHFKDWDYSTKITDTQYFPNNTSNTLNNQVQYSHKKRLNSDKVLSACVGIEISTTGVSFEIESFEVEFNTIQSGMKK
jgi:hypothetical protein